MPILLSKSHLRTLMTRGGLLSLAAAGLISDRALSKEPNSSSVPARHIILETGDDIAFSLLRIQAHSGETLIVTIKNKAPTDTSDVRHAVAFFSENLSSDPRVNSLLEPSGDRLPLELVEICIGASSEVSPSQGHTFSLRAPLSSGEYSYLCTVPGHALLGMQGILAVQ